MQSSKPVRTDAWTLTVFRFAMPLALAIAHTVIIAPGGFAAEDALRVGGYVQNVDPHQLPVPVNGGFVQQMADRVIDPLAARTLVIQQGEITISLTVVDSCLLPRDLLDAAKAAAAEATGIPPANMLVSATHAHSVPAVMGIHGSEPDMAYRDQLRDQIAESIIEAHRRLRPARVGWGTATLDRFVYCRRWLMQPGTAMTVPFTGRDANQVQMNPGHQNPNKIRPVGPVDTDVIVLAFQSPEGEPLAVLGNFNTHYAGAPALSSDYFGHFCRKIGDRLDASEDSFVALMSNGTSGDANCIDFSQPEPVPFTAAEVADAVMDKAIDAYRGIETWHSTAPIAMLQQTLTLAARMPSDEEVAKAREITASWIDERLPENVHEVYARETILMSQMPPTREVVLQAIRIGDFAITATPCEVYGVTGLWLKSNSPFATTMNIGWANDYLGYLPPPEHFELGGYTTWRARSSCLETEAEPKIRETLVGMLNRLSEQDAAAGNSEDLSTRDAVPRRHPLPPEESLAEFQTDPSVRVELAASEPQVVDPVSIAFDHQGRMWVVEMGDYPMVPPDAERFQGRIKILSDRDHDGFYESATTFADNLVMPTGLTPFRNGVIVTLAGEIRYLADNDGDSVCDHQETWFTGFAQDNEQLRANHPTWTLDGRIRVASGLRGGAIAPASDRWTPRAEPVSLAMRDLEFNPFGGNYSAVAGNSQYGYFQDESGQILICSNRNPCQLVLIEAAQAAANPLLPISQWIVDVMPAAERSQIFPLVDAWTTSTMHAGQFTAACGVFRYQSDLLAPLFRDAFFACEPTGSLVQCYLTVDPGIVPHAERREQNVEFLASRDPWFRPVDITDGPDGAIYVVDMHRAVIEHPEWVPDELKHREDERWGNEAGRIYRIVPNVEPESPPDDSLEVTNLTELARALGHPNRWRRSTATRLLVEAALGESDESLDRREAVAEALHHALHSGGLASPAGVSRTLWLLGRIGRLDAAALRVGLEHPSAMVRRQAVRMWATSDESVRGAVPMAPLAADPDPRVRFEVLVQLAPRAGEQDIDLLLCAAEVGASDDPRDRPWIAKAVSLVSGDVAVAFLRRGLSDGRLDAATVTPLLSRLGWSGRGDALAMLMEIGPEHPDAQAVVTSFIRGMATGGRTLQQLSPPLELPHSEVFESLVSQARRTVTDASLEVSRRLEVMPLVVVDPSPESLEVRRQLLASGESALFLAALDSLSKSPSAAIGTQLIERLPELAPGDAQAALAAMVSNAEWAPLLVDAVQSGRLPRGWVDPASRDRLMRHPDPQVRTRAEEAFARPNAAAIEAMLGRYRAALDSPADPSHGREVFRQHCASCHRLDGVGSAVGPDISDLRTQTREQILTAILDPNAAIDASYFRYSILTTDGQILDGLLRDHTEESATLSMQNGEERTVSTEEIDAIKASGVSLMPEGFEDQIAPEAMRDLVDYLKRWRLMDGAVPVAE